MEDNGRLVWPPLVTCKRHNVGRETKTGIEIMANDINTDSDAYNTGYAAHDAGEPRTANPYVTGTWESINWLAGWDAA